MRCPRAYRAKLPASAFAVLRFVASSKTVGVFPGRSPALGTLQNSVEIVRTLCHAPSGSLRIGSSLVASLRLAPAARSAFRFAFNLERSRNGVARAGLHLARSLFARYAHSFPPCSEPEAERFPRCSAPRSRSDLAHTRVEVLATAPLIDAISLAYFQYISQRKEEAEPYAAGVVPPLWRPSSA
jgi:hypothetical protein